MYHLAPEKLDHEEDRVLRQTSPRNSPQPQLLLRVNTHQKGGSEAAHTYMQRTTIHIRSFTTGLCSCLPSLARCSLKEPKPWHNYAEHHLGPLYWGDHVIPT